jgi:hypothetical protein
MAMLPQGSKISGRCDSELSASTPEHLALEQLSKYMIESWLVRNSLQDLAENYVHQSESLPRNLSMQPLHLGVANSAKVINPDGCIYDDHWLFNRTSLPGLREVTFPAYFSFQSANAYLSVRLHKQAESRLHHRAFSPPFAGAHGLAHQAIINFNIRSSAHSHLPVCVRIAYLCVPVKSAQTARQRSV